MEFDLNRTEFVKTQKTKYVIQTSIFFQTCIDCIVQNDIFLKVTFSLCFKIIYEMFYLLHCFTFA